MKIIIKIIFLLCTACSISNVREMSEFNKLDHIWKKKLNSKEVVLILKEPSLKKDLAFIYNFQNSNIPKILITFSNEGYVQTIFYFMENNDFFKQKLLLKCDNEVRQPTNILGHIYDESHTGRCLENDLTFNKNSSINSYEIYWKSKHN
jgi:hypothetical protein